MNLSNLLPPSDLLNQVRDVEKGLRQRKRLSSIGWIGFLIASAVQIALEVSRLGFLSKSGDDLIQFVRTGWPYLIPVFLAVICFLIATWSSFWLQETRTPFRYTCCIDPFVNINGAVDSNLIDTRLTWLALDLKQLLNQRVARFRFLEQPQSKGALSKDAETEERSWPDAHISISGHYIVRPSSPVSIEASDPEALQEIEIMPAVRIGPNDNPASLALPPPPLPLSKPNELKRTEYDNLLELAYHSIVTEVYRQLKEDVQRKIELLPTRRLRAMALFNEAEDYARSNALRAYEEARDLYQQAAALIDPVWRSLGESGLWRRWGLLQRRWFRIRAWGRRIQARLRPDAASIDVLCARAEIGYARMLLFRRTVALLQGAASNAVFEARGRAARALERLEPLEASVPGRGEALFHARVTLALALNDLGDPAALERQLELAEQLDPKRATTDPLFVFARSNVAGHGEGRLGMLRRALDLQPRFEVVGFLYAQEMEQQWRGRDQLDPSLATLVLREYEQLRRINPNNVAAWANSGYVHWLLGPPEHLEKAGKQFNRGRTLKDIKRDASVAELEYGLCRLYCETGNFVQAFEHYRNAFFDVFSQGLVRLSQEFRSYYFVAVGPAMLRRFRKYGVTARNWFREARIKDRAGRLSDEDRARFGSPETRRTLAAFVLNDVGEAYLASYLQTYNETHKATARRLFRRAVRLFGANPLVRYNEAELLSNLDALKSLEIVHEHAPLWMDGLLRLASVCGLAGVDKVSEAVDLSGKANQLRLENLSEAINKLRHLKEQARTQVAPAAVTKQAQSHVPKDPKDLKRISNAPAKVSGGRVSDFDKQINDAAAEIKGFIKEIRVKRKRAEDARKRGAKLSADAEQLARQLLPNTWLWRKQGDKMEFDWASLQNWIYRDELRWERDLDDLHVSALWTWVQPQLQRLEGKQDTTSPPTKSHLRSNGATHRQHIIDLLQHIRGHFWPQASGLLEHLFLLDSSEDNKRRIVDPIYEKLDRNPTDVATLRLLNASYFDINDRIKRAKVAFEKQPDNREIACLFAETLRDARKKLSFEELCRLHDLAKSLANHAECHEVFADLFLALYDEDESDGSLRARAIDALERYCVINPQNDNGNRRRSLERLLLTKRNVEAGEMVQARFGSFAAGLKERISPLAIEFSSDLAPLLDEDPQSKAAIARAEALQNLRLGLLYELGVLFPLPEFRLTSATVVAQRYTIFLNGVSLVGNDLFLNRWFFSVRPERLAEAAIPAEPGINPANGNPGSWVAEAHWEAARKFAEEQDDVYFWPPFAFTTLHIAAVCRMNAAEFLDMNKTDAHLTFSVIAGRLRDSSAERIRQNNQLQPLTNVLRALLAEQFPIRELKSIIEVFRSNFARTQNLVEVCEAIRSHPSLKRENPFLSKKGCYFTLGRDFQCDIENGLVNGNHRVLAVEPEVCQELLAAVRTAVQSFGSNMPWPTGLVSRALLRPWIRRLVELEFPHLPVLAEEDVIPEFADRIRGSFDREGNIEWLK